MTDPVVITEPGVYAAIPDDVYHSDPIPSGSLSHTGALQLLVCPARYRHEQANPRHKDVWDFGHVLHKAVLGTGPPVVTIDAADWRTKAAKEARDAARAEGCVPLLAADAQRVAAMVDAVYAHPLASVLLDRARTEQSMFWQVRGGTWCRGRVDLLDDPQPATVGRRPILADYKTCADASNEAFSRAAASYGYHQQAAFYTDGYYELTHRLDTAFLFIAQEKEPPYLVNVIELDEEAIGIGRARNLAALDLYERCKELDDWPGYPPEIQQVPLPRWAVIAHQNEYEDLPW